MSSPNLEAPRAYFRDLQTRLIRDLRAMDPEAPFKKDDWTRPVGGGGSTQVLGEGAIWEKGGVNFSEVHGPGLPPSASAHRPELAGQGFHAMGVSVVIHPRNPYVPTTHLNVRFFTTTGDEPVWWFGGGFDLTPYYGFEEDAVQWHRTAREACAAVDATLYPRFKEACDHYFHLPHRGEARGVGGLFFDDFNELGFDRSFALTRAVGDAFWRAFAPIAERRHATDYGERERQWQLYRRGRYVEFNLLHDRGTLFGIQSGGRTESILMSLPPLVRWEYAPGIADDSPEARLLSEFLPPRDWLADAAPNK